MRILLRSFASSLLLLGGCSDSGTQSDLATVSAHPDLAMAPPDLTPYNPRNPTGAGPAVVPLGSGTDVGAPGSYVLLAKTGVTNVTGSAITGGNVGVSPAAASFITGFSMIADSTNVF
jgi:hypothetical protein